jgi:SAM-dependent methyltransferase
MHRLALVAAVAACSHPPPASRPAPPATEAEIVAKSHAVLDAYDWHDGAALEAALAPSFVKFENQHLQDRAALLKGMSGPRPALREMTRAWDEDHAYLGGDHAVFIGKATEHETGNDSHGNRAFTGWYTLAWVRDHGAWRVAHWAWQPHRTSIDNAREMWNDMYRQGVGFNHEPNRLLVDTVRGTPPGAALDLMMGQGRNALYLAAQGWKVTGIDLSDEGLRLAREAAARQHLALDAVQADVDHYDFGVARWDLVTMIYAGSSTKMIERLKPSLKPGGRFVLEFFANVPGESNGFKPGQLAQLFGPEFEIQRDDVVDDVPDWARDRAKLVRFVARKK